MLSANDFASSIGRVYIVLFAIITYFLPPKKLCSRVMIQLIGVFEGLVIMAGFTALKSNGHDLSIKVFEFDL
jgi:hypothetical protein